MLSPQRRAWASLQYDCLLSKASVLKESKPGGSSVTFKTIGGYIMSLPPFSIG